jgi:hypothetical protein
MKVFVTVVAAVFLVGALGFGVAGCGSAREASGLLALPQEDEDNQKTQDDGDNQDDGDTQDVTLALEENVTIAGPGVEFVSSPHQEYNFIHLRQYTKLIMRDGSRISGYYYAEYHSGGGVGHLITHLYIYVDKRK